MKRIASMPMFQRNFFRNIRQTKTAHLPGLGLEKYAEALRHNWQKLALLGLFALGLLLGAKTAGYASAGWQANLLELLRAQRLGRADNTMLHSALGYFCTDLLFMLAAFVLGLCAAGLPLLLLLPVLRGLGLGAVSGWLYMTYGVTGMGYSLLVLYPAALISVLAMLSYCRESMLMSGDMLLMLSGKQERGAASLRLYAMRYSAMLMASALAAVVDALCFSAFSGIFNL